MYEEHIREHGTEHEYIFLRKFHPELNPIDAMDDIFKTECINGKFYDWDNEECPRAPTFDMTEALASGNAEDLEYIEDVLEYCGLLDDEDDE